MAVFGIEPALDRSVEQRLYSGSGLCRSFDDVQWTLVTGNVNANSPDRQQRVVQMQPVDPDHHKIQLREIGSHPRIECGLRQRLEPPG